MLGNSTGHRIASAVAVTFIAAAVIALGACAKNVKQNAHTGEDGKYGGAKPILLKNDKGSASGIVTYPGGDRVDWKVIDLPKDKRGKVEIELTWKPPRPGLDLAFDVYNEWGTKIGSVSPKKPGKGKKKKPKKKVTVGDGEPADKDAKPVKGKLYVAVYASNRGDAGKYKLKVEFTEEEVAIIPVFDPGAVSIPEPPKLAAVPPPCDPMAIDPKNPECKGVHPPCDEAKPDPKNPNCSGVSKPCDPQALDPLNPSCLPYYPECDPKAIDKKNPKCTGVVAPPPDPITATITAVETSSSSTIIHINRGTKDGVDMKWTGDIVDSSGNPVTGGAFKIYKVQDKKCYAKVKLTKAQVDKNKTVKLYPPQ